MASESGASAEPAAAPVHPVDAGPAADRGDVLDESIDLSQLEARRLHPSSLFFRLGPTLRSMVLPMLPILLFSPASRTQALLFFGLVPIVVILHVVGYLAYRYHLGPRQMVIRHGVLTRNERHIPYRRIQNIDLRQNPLHRLFKVYEARLETASGGKPEAVMTVLDQTAIDELRAHALPARSTADGDVANDDGSDRPLGAHAAADDEADATRLVTLGPIDLVWVGLVSRRGFVLAAALLGLLSQFDANAPEEMAEAAIRDGMEALNGAGGVAALPAWLGDPHPVTIGLLAALAGVAVIALLQLVSILWAFITFHGFRLIERRDAFRATYGLINRITATVPRRRIQVVNLSRPLLFRWLRRCAVRVETAGGDQDGPDSGRPWLAPTLPDDRVPDLLERALPAMLPAALSDDAADAIDWRPLAPGARGRLLRLRTALVLVVAGGAALLLHAAAALVALPLLMLLFVSVSRHVAYTGYALLDDAIAIRRGAWRRRIDIVPYSKLQVVECAASPFDRRLSMATVRIDTAGAVQRRTLGLRFLDAEDARALYRHLDAVAGRTTFRW
ncbi:MAG: PH domain-containing protein [Acidobacteriota bacterium]